MAIDLERFPTSETAKRMMSRVSQIYDRSYVAKWLYQVMGLEWDKVRLVMASMWEQPFLEQATWGLRYWEQAYGLDTDETKSYEERRRLVSAKRSYKKPMNPARLEMMLSNLTGGSAVVTENIAAYTFRVELDTQGNPIDYDSVIRLIRQVKPSHQSLRLYIISTANVKIRPRIGKYKFPYRMTGEHPDINVWGGVERGHIDVAASAKGHLFPYPVTGPHLAGTVPDENTLGFIRETAAEVGASGTGAVFPYTPAGVGVAGTLPDTSIPAYIRNAGIEAQASGEGLVFPYVQTGTRPDVNTAGYVRRTSVRNEAEANGTVFPYPQAGMRPDVNMAGGQSAAGIVNAADGNGTVFPYGPAGEVESGTQPDTNLSGALRRLGLQSAVSGSGTVFPYPSAGEREAGTVPDENFPGSLSAGVVTARASGEGAVFPYAATGETPDVNLEGLRQAVDIRNAASGYGAAFAYALTGLEAAGTIPDEQAAGSGNDAALTGTATGSGTVIDYPLCGDDDD